MTSSKDDRTADAPFHTRAGQTHDAIAIAAAFRSARASLSTLPNLHSAADDERYFALQLTHHTSLVAVAGDTVVGFALFDDGWLHHLYVAREHQGRGIGAALLALVQGHSAGSLQLWTFQQNVGARRFYERHGFTCVEETDGAGNEERLPDARYLWRRETSVPSP